MLDYLMRDLFFKTFYKIYEKSELERETFLNLTKYDLSNAFGMGLPRSYNQLVKQLNSKLEKLINIKKYVASFSKSPFNPLMFSHYASEGKGFVIIFNKNIRFYNLADKEVDKSQATPHVRSTHPFVLNRKKSHDRQRCYEKAGYFLSRN